MWTLIKLINKYFWRGYIGPIFAFFVPAILLLFLGRIMGPTLLIPGVYSVPVLSIFLIFMPQSIFEFKNSSLLKRIGSTPMNPYKFLLAISVFNLVIVISAFLFTFLFSFVVFYDSLELVNESVPIIQDPISGLPIFSLYQPSFLWMLTHADWPSYIYSLLVFMILTMSIGLLIASVSRSTLVIQSVGISFMIITLFVGPTALPIAMVGSVDVIKWFGYILPLKYPISTMVESFTSGTVNSITNIDSSSIWNINESYRVFNLYSPGGIDNNLILEVFNPVDKVLNLVMPYVFIAIFVYLTMASFSWSTRSAVSFNWRIITKAIIGIKTFLKHKEFNEKLTNTLDLNSKYILELENISKTFNKGKKNEVKATNDVSFKIKRGVNTAILGSNGAGKTVLVEMILGINKPDSGNFKYNFQFDKSFQEKVGIQFQDSSYPVGIKCKDVVEFLLNIYKVKYSDEELAELIKVFGLTEFYNKPASSLSGGQQQRLNLLLSILHKPSLLFLDELSTGLDIKIRTEIKTFIKEYAKNNNITIVIISHDMNEVDYICEDIVVIKKGQVVDEKAKDQILENEDLETYISRFL